MIAVAVPSKPTLMREISMGAGIGFRPDREINEVLQSQCKAVDDEQLMHHEDMRQGLMRHTQEYLQDKKDMRAIFVADGDANEVEFEMETQQSARRLEKFFSIVDEQKTVHDKIMARVKEAEKEAGDSRHSPGPTECLSPSEHPASPHLSPRHQPIASGTRAINARVLAEKIERQHASKERFRDGQRSVLEKKLKSHEALYASLDAFDRSHTQRNQERAHAQHMKMVVAEKKYTEHQKMLRQIQKDQDRQWKLMKEKVYASGPQALVARPGSSPANKSPSSDAKDEAIYMHMLQSHSKYGGALTNFQQIEAETDRRKEAKWLKIAPEAWQKKKNEEEDERSKSKRSRSKIKTMKGAVELVCVAHDITHSICSPTPLTGSAIMRENSEVFSPKGASSRDDGSPKSVYEMRLMRCKELQQEQEYGRQQKLAIDAAKLAAHQDRGRYEVAKKANAAGSMVQAWDSKSTDAAARRQMQNVTNSDDFFQKHLERSTTFAEFREQQERDLEDRTAKNTNLANANLQEAQRVAQTIEQERRARQEEKATSSETQVTQKLEAAMRNCASPKHANQLQAIFQRKQVSEEDFRKQAASQIENKLKRSTSALIRVKKSPSALQNLEARRPQSSTAAQRRKPTMDVDLPPQMTPSSGLFALSSRPASPASPSSRSPSSYLDQITTADLLSGSAEDELLKEALRLKGRQNFIISPKSDPHGVSPASTANEESEAPVREQVAHVDNSRQRLETGLSSAPSDAACRTSSKMSQRAASKSPRASPASNAGGVRRQSNVSAHTAVDDSDMEEEDFLQDLESRSAKWLREARKKR